LVVVFEEFATTLFCPVRAGLTEQVDDLDQRGAVDRFVRLLSRDELVRARKVGGCQVEGVHRRKTRFGCFRLRRSLDLVDIAVPYCVREVSAVERPFQPLLKEALPAF
jgi:hypothetical protein